MSRGAVGGEGGVRVVKRTRLPGYDGSLVERIVVDADVHIRYRMSISTRQRWLWLIGSEC